LEDLDADGTKLLETVDPASRNNECLGVRV